MAHLLVPATQEPADDVRERAADRRRERERAVFAETLPPAAGQFHDVALIDAEEMMRLVHLHQARRAERVAEGQKPAGGIRPAVHHPLRAALPAEADAEQ